VAGIAALIRPDREQEVKDATVKYLGRTGRRTAATGSRTTTTT
jgi:hypothetical protein